jgi:hypothetical protein
MLKQKLSGLFAGAEGSFLPAEFDYGLHDLVVKVTGLPSSGKVLRADGLSEVNIGETLTAAELAALDFTPAYGRSTQAQPWGGVVLYVPQGCGRLPIPLPAELMSGSAVDSTVSIIELPSNGSVFLANAMTALVSGQVVTAAQLCGLTFSPACDAVGQISLLRYQSADRGFTGEVLLVVGPDVPLRGTREVGSADDGNSVAPLAAALLLGAGLSSLNSTAASAAVDYGDLVAPDPSSPSGVTAGATGEGSGQTTASAVDHIIPDHIAVPASMILAQSTPPETDTTGSTGTNDPASDQPPPKHRIGSSTPPDSSGSKMEPVPGSNLLTPASLNSMGTTAAPTQALGQPAPLSSDPTTGLLSQSLIITPLSSPTASSPTAPPSVDDHRVDVVLNGAGPPPRANDDSGFAATKGSALTIAASALLANDSDPSGLPFLITSVGNPVNGTVSYNAQTQAVTFTPSAGYTGAASFTYVITSSTGASDTGQVAVDVNYPVDAQSLFDSNDTPTTVDSGDFSPIEVGIKFSASVNGLITGIRFYKGELNTGTHVADLWSASGTLLASATFTNESASGWQQVNFDTPVAITAGATYVAAYRADGDYSASQNYFSDTLTNGELIAGNGVYAYGSGGVFPTNTYNDTNYWVDVVFDGSMRPVASNDGTFVVGQSGTITIAAATLLANDTDLAGLPLSVTGVSAPVNGTVSYDANTQTLTFVSTGGYSGAASFTYTVGDSSGGSASAQVSLFVNDPASQSLFSLDSTPGVVTTNDTNSVELGVKFTADANGLITGLRFYKGLENTGTHVADLWSSNGTLLASATFADETASGWQQVNFATPVAITAGTTYVASYHTSGNYSADPNFFADPVTSGDLTAPSTGNGVYAYGSGSTFPTETFSANNYWVDVVYTKTLLPPVANADGGFIVNEDGSITIAASALLANDTDPNGLPLWIAAVGNASNGTVSYDSNAQSVTFVPTAGYTGTASFTYSVSDNGGGIASAGVSMLVVDPTASSLFDPATAPSVVTVNDPNPVELGVKFQATTDGFITGIRFYKGPDNTGAHVADLWSSTGTLLATATFTNETPTGWQQVNFAAPVAVTAGTTYVASYHTSSGEYSADPNLFATAVTNGPLTAPSSSSSGGNGVYAYGGSSLFPTSNFNSTSYGVDVVFKPQLAA